MPFALDSYLALKNKDKTQARLDIVLAKAVIAISNQGIMLGGGEYSFLSFISSLYNGWVPFAIVPEEAELASELRRRNVNTRILPLPTIRPWTLINMLLCVANLIYFCCKRDAILIYANGSRAAFYAGLVGRILKIPVIWHCRIAEKDVHLDFLLRRFSHRIIVNSQATAARFSSHSQPKIRIVYNGLDLARLSDNTVRKPALIDEEWKLILVVARLSRCKRHDLILSAFETVAKRDLSVHLVCIGAMDQFEPYWWRHLQQRTAQSSVSDRIHWIGQVDDVRPWYRAALVMVLASDNESFGRVIVEAMASGVPVIATRGGGIPEIIRQGQDGLLVSSGNHKEIADAITKVLDDQSLRRRLVKSARKRAELFDLGRHVQNMLEVFEEAARQ